MTIEDVHNIQKEFDEAFMSIPDHEKSWTVCCKPFVDRLDKLFDSNKYVRTSPSRNIDVYIEMLANRLVFKPEKLPVFVNLYIITKHPMLINIIYNNMNYDEWKDYSAQLLEELDVFYANKTLGEYEECKKMLTVDYKQDTIQSLSALNYFHYLYGFSFNSKYISIPFKELSNNGGNDTLCINATYNLDYLDSIVNYHDIPSSSDVFISDKMIEDTVPYTMTPPTRATEMYTMYDRNMKKTDRFVTKYVNIVLDYNNGYVTRCLKKIYQKDNNEPFEVMNVPLTQAMDMINGRVKYSYNKNDLLSYLKTDFYNQFSIERRSIEELKKTYSVISSVVNMSFEENSIHKTIANIKSNPLLNDIIHVNEKKYFDLYVDSMVLLDIPNRTYVYEWLIEYIYPNGELNKLLFN